MRRKICGRLRGAVQDAFNLDGGESSVRGWSCGPALFRRPLESRATPAEDEVEDHDQQDQVEAAPTVVTDSGTHVITPAAN